jgi:phospholipase C
MADVITRFLVDDTIAIRARVPLDPDPETREYRFRVNLASDREIAMGSRTVTVLVRLQGDEIGTFPVEATLFRPDGSIAAGPIVMENRRQPPLSQPRVVRGDISFALNTGADISGGLGRTRLDPDTPPPSPITRLEHEILTDDPNGVWRVTLTNRGDRDGIFRVLIAHPGAQVTLRRSTVPITLIDRMFKKIVTLANPQLRIDRRAVVTFSREFEELTELGPQHFGDDLRARDIQLDNFELGFTGNGETPIIHLGARFETTGPEEIAVDFLDDINFTKLEFGLDIELGNDFSSLEAIVPNQRPVLEERLDFVGNRVSEASGQVSLDLILDVRAEASANVTTDFFADLVEDVEVDNLDDYIRHSFFAVVRRQDSQAKLRVAAEHITDTLLFLATGSRDRLFFDVLIEQSDLVLTHYKRPTVLDLLNPHGPDGDVAVAPIPEPVAASPGGGTAAVPGLIFRTASPSGANVAAPVAGLDTANGPNRGGRAVDHIVVLMMENRSFDHMLGYLKLERGRADIDGLTSETVNTNPVPGSQSPQGIHRLEHPIILIDPDHSHGGTLLQVAAGAMTGFVQSYLGRKPAPGDERLVMGFYNDFHVGVFDQFAREYKICDRWFCSHPGPTYPNRFISLSGSTPSINNLKLDGDLAGAVKTDTIFDILTRHGISWTYVESNIAFLRMFDRHRVDEENIVQRRAFFEQLQSGPLPAVTWIDPNFGELEIDREKNDDHPPADIRMGQNLIADIYRELSSDTERWRKTLFIVTYDEHGGFYDHVPPHGLNGQGPPVHKIHPDGETFLGCRVPAFLISPLVGRGLVTHEIYDHTSILKTILLNFIGPEATTQELLGQRVDAANDLLGELLSAPRADIPNVTPMPEIVFADPDSLAGRPVDPESFHLGMRLFPLGAKLKSLIAK